MCPEADPTRGQAPIGTAASVRDPQSRGATVCGGTPGASRPGHGLRRAPPVSVKAFARRYGVDCYTAYADLIAIGFRLAPADNRWAVRPGPTPKRPPAEPADFSADSGEGWVWIGEQRMFVVGYTPGGAPYGWIDNRMGGADDRLP